MLDRLAKLYTQDKNTLYKDIRNHKKTHNNTIVNFLYFANVVKNKLPKQTKTKIQTLYYNSLMTGEFLLPDGIALQAFYRIAHLIGYVDPKKIPNLNGTDFVPYFLQKCKKEKKKIRIHLYGASVETLEKAKKYFAQYARIGYIHHGYEDINNKQIQNLHKKLSKNYTNIVLIARGTPTQENRAHKHKKSLPNTIVFTVGGLFDFMTGEETRAPQRMRGRGEWLYRLIINPKKNGIKVWYTLKWIPYIFRYLLLKRLTDSIRSR